MSHNDGQNPKYLSQKRIQTANKEGKMIGFILIGKIKDICQVLRVLTEFEREMTNLLADGCVIRL